MGSGIEALPPHLKGITRFASITGWRKQEILGLQWSNVDTAGKVIRLDPESTKNDEGREVPYGVLPELEDLLGISGPTQTVSSVTSGVSHRGYSITEANA